MKHANKSVCLGTLLAIFALAPASVSAQGESGFYLGLSVGETKVKGWRGVCDEAAAASGGAVVRCDDKYTAWKIVGGYQFNRNFGLEVGYVGKVSAEFDVGGVPVSVSGKAKGFDFVGVGTLPLADRFSVYGKAGLFRWDARGRISVVGIVETLRYKRVDFTYGLGLKFDFTRNLSGRLEFQRYNDIVDTDVNVQGFNDVVVIDVNVWSVGLKYRF